MNSRYKRHFRFLFRFVLFSGHLNDRLLGRCVFHEPLGKVPADFSRVDCFKGFSAGWRSDAAGTKTGRNPAIEGIHAADRPSGALIRPHQKSISRKPCDISFPALRYYTFRNCRPARATNFFLPSQTKSIFCYPVKICECILDNKPDRLRLFRVYFPFV